MGSNLRQAARALARSRAVAGLAIGALALGIGITTAVFSLYYGVLVRPLPFPNPDELTVVYGTQPACVTCPASYPKYVEWSTRNTVFAALGGSASGQVVLTGGGDPERVNSARVTATLVNDVFRTRPELGRWFSADEDTPGGPKVVVLGHGLWQRRFGKQASVLGQTLVVNGEPHAIVGVMPSDFTHRRAEIFVPLQMTYDPAQRGNHFLGTYGRLKPGVSVARAQQEMVALGAVLAREFGHNHGIDVQPYHQVVVAAVAAPLRVLMAGVVLVLVIAAANVANLLLASGLARRRELAVRTALGATRWDLARQLATESLLLAMAGGALGLLVARWATSTFIDIAGATLPRATSVAIDWWVVGFALGVSVLTGLLCSVWPIARLKVAALAGEVREGDMRAGAGRSSRRVGNRLVVAEVAMAFTLVAGAGLLIKSLRALEARDTGFSTARVITFDVAPTGPRYATEEPMHGFYRSLLPQLAAIPGVEKAGLTSHVPMVSFGWNGEVLLESGNPWPANDAPLVEVRWIGGDYFDAIGARRLKGRYFDATDRRGNRPFATVITERTAEKFWPGQDPIGRRFYRGGSATPGNDFFQVVGVIEDVRSFGLDRTSPYEMYMSMDQRMYGSMAVVLRTTNDDPTVVMAGARQAIKSVDPDLPISRVQTLADAVAASVNQPRLISALAALFGSMAGLMAAVGVYGVMAYNVRRERREIGVRLALGANPWRVRRLILTRGALLGGAGIALGSLAAYWMSGAMRALLAEVEPTDPTVYGAAAAVLLAVALASVAWPARQAGRIDPVIALRGD